MGVFPDALVQTADGKLLTVFARNGALWSRPSTDGGATWAAETQIAGCCRYNHSLRARRMGPCGWPMAAMGEIWYRTSADGGVTWSAERQLATDSRKNTTLSSSRRLTTSCGSCGSLIAPATGLDLVQDQCGRRRHLVGR